MTEPKRKLDEYGPNEMAIPEIRLLQKTGGDYAKSQGATPGQFYNNLSDEIMDELNIIIVDILSGRARWGAEIKNVGPVCACVDTKTNKSIYGNDCDKCEYRMDAPWSLDATERRKMCCLNYTILGIDLDHDYMPIMLRAHGVSALPARQLITQLKMNRRLRGEYHKAIINIKSTEKDTVYGITYSLRPKIIELITDEIKAEELRVESQRLLGAPLPLPEGRPEEEGEPLGYTPLGTPFYSEDERNTILPQEVKIVAEPLTEIEEPLIEEPATTISHQPFGTWGDLAQAAYKLGVKPEQVLKKAEVKKWQDFATFENAWKIVEAIISEKTENIKSPTEIESKLDMDF